MSIGQLEVMTAELPSNFRGQVIGYARSVREAAPEIFRQASVLQDEALTDQLVFVAGLRKFHAIVASTFWTIHSALTDLQRHDIRTVRISGRRHSVGSSDYRRLRLLNDDLRELMQAENLLRFNHTSYVTVVQVLADERRYDR